MKKEFILLMLFATILGFWVYNCSGRSFFQRSQKFDVPIDKTHLNWIEVSGGKFSTQIMFDFSRPFYFEKSMEKSQRKLELSFPGMHIVDFKKNDVINKLKKIDLIKNVYIDQKNKPINRVVLTIIFKSFHSDKTHQDKNGFVIKWSKIEDPNRLILDIFKKEKLYDLKRDKSLILHARNNFSNDFLLSKKKSLLI